MAHSDTSPTRRLYILGALLLAGAAAAFLWSGEDHEHSHDDCVTLQESSTAIYQINTCTGDREKVRDKTPAEQAEWKRQN